MSVNKSKLKKIIISIICIVLVAVIATSIFLLIRNKNKSKTENSPVENVGQTAKDIEEQINSDIINQNVCVDYCGNYIFDSIQEITFDTNLSASEKLEVFKELSNNHVNVKDTNTFTTYLSIQKHFNTSKEIITLVNGKYTKSIGSTKAETGLFFGNENKSIIFKYDKKGETIIDEKTYSPSHEISLTGYWLPNIILSSNDIIYIREKIYYGNAGLQCMYITSAYKMINLATPE